MRIVGNRQVRPITFGANNETFAEGVRFNDEMKRLPTGNMGYIKKGVYRFCTHSDANQHQDEAQAQMMAKIADERVTHD
jgi:hypothetical protein